MISVLVVLGMTAFAQPSEPSSLPFTRLRQLPEPAMARVWLEASHARRRPEFGLRIELEDTLRALAEIGWAPSKPWDALVFGRTPPSMGWLRLELGARLGIHQFSVAPGLVVRAESLHQVPDRDNQAAQPTVMPAERGGTLSAGIALELRQWLWNQRCRRVGLLARANLRPVASRWGRAKTEPHPHGRIEGGLAVDDVIGLRLLGGIQHMTAESWEAPWTPTGRLELTVRSRGKDPSGGDKDGGEGTR